MRGGGSGSFVPLAPIICFRWQQDTKGTPIRWPSTLSLPVQTRPGACQGAGRLSVPPKPGAGIQLTGGAGDCIQRHTAQPLVLPLGPCWHPDHQVIRLGVLLRVAHPGVPGCGAQVDPKGRNFSCAAELQYHLRPFDHGCGMCVVVGCVAQLGPDTVNSCPCYLLPSEPLGP